MDVLSQQSIALLLINFELELDKKLQSYAERLGWSGPPQYSATPEDTPKYPGDEYYSYEFPLTARFEKEATIMEIPYNQLVSNNSIGNKQNSDSVYRWLFRSVMRTADDIPLRHTTSIEV